MAPTQGACRRCRCLAGAWWARLVLCLAISALKCCSGAGTPLSGRLYIIDTHDSEKTWFLTTGGGALDPNSQTYRLPGQPAVSAAAGTAAKGADGNELRAGDWVQLVCTTAVGKPFACSSVSQVRRTTPPGGYAPGFSAAGAAKEPIRLLLMIVSLMDNPNVPSCQARPAAYTVNQVTKKLFGAGGIAELFDQCSYGKTRILPGTTRVELAPIPCIPVDRTTCDFQAIGQAAASGIKERLGDAVWQKYNRKMYIMPAGTYTGPGEVCGWNGLGQAPGGQTWLQATVNGFYFQGTVMQELLHNFGLQHGYRNGVEYADDSTCMGRGNVCPSAYELARLQWLYPRLLRAEDLRLGSFMTFTLVATYVGAANSFLKIVTDWVSPAPTSLFSAPVNIYMALRVARKGDARLNSEFDGKISVHLVDRAIDENPDSILADDPRPDLWQLIDETDTDDLYRFRLLVRTGALLDGGTRMEVALCRYDRNPSECSSSSQQDMPTPQRKPSPSPPPPKRPPPSPPPPRLRPPPPPKEATSTAEGYCDAAPPGSYNYTCKDCGRTRDVGSSDYSACTLTCSCAPIDGAWQLTSLDYGSCLKIKNADGSLQCDGYYCAAAPPGSYSYTCKDCRRTRDAGSSDYPACTLTCSCARIDGTWQSTSLNYGSCLEILNSDGILKCSGPASCSPKSAVVHGVNMADSTCCGGRAPCGSDSATDWVAGYSERNLVCPLGSFVASVTQKVAVTLAGITGVVQMSITCSDGTRNTKAFEAVPKTVSRVVKGPPTVERYSTSVGFSAIAGYAGCQVDRLAWLEGSKDPSLDYLTICPAGEVITGVRIGVGHLINNILVCCVKNTRVHI